MKRIPLMGYPQGRRIGVPNSAKIIIGYMKVDDEDYDRMSTKPWAMVRVKDETYVSRRERCNLGMYHTVWAHRMVMGLGAGTRTRVTHINDDGLDNRKKNLLVCKGFVVQHTESRGKTPGNGKKKTNKRTSRYIGVTWSHKDEKWLAYGRSRNKHKYLGVFMTKIALAGPGTGI